jgi:outer membrane protein OmpA-like peptidoglycan-associated protein
MERLRSAPTRQSGGSHERPTASAPSRPSRIPGHPLRGLHRALGNQAVGRLVQGKLKTSPPAIQRLGDTTKVPSDLKCFVPNVTGANPGTSIMFGQNSSALSATDERTLSSVAAAWHSGGGAGVLTVIGFASSEGNDPYNWRLSCRRATAVADEIAAPTDRSPGVPTSNIRTLAEGETSEFSATARGPNRRVVIMTTGRAPAPGPPCGLSITGLDQVDHYCAPYVPSDAASCGVYPAPPATLTAVGAAAGATLSWSITAGNIDRAYIDGPSNGTTVNIRGYRPSRTAKDVTVQLTDGHCTVTHRMTVRQPSSFSLAQAPSRGARFVQNRVTYTVLDQFGNAMGANICVDENVTVCADNSGLGPVTFRDAQTDTAGQVTDRVRSGFPGPVPLGLCVKADQRLTAGGCGPLLHNTILIRWSGVTVTQGGGCSAGDPCP